MSPTAATDTAADVTCTGARRRHDTSLAGRLNAEWAGLRSDPASAATVEGWAHDHAALAGCASLPDVEQAVTAGTREQTDHILITLLRLGQAGQPLALRTVFQLMLGKAIRIAATHAGRDTRAYLEHTAVTALWTTIASYPVDRRPTKIAANIAMDTLRQTVDELAHQRHESPASPDSLHGRDAAPHDGPADLELLNLLAWAVDEQAVTAQDATLLLDIYAPAPGERGGAAAAARHGLTWPAARQRASRAVRRVSRAVQADSLAVTAA